MHFLLKNNLAFFGNNFMVVWKNNSFTALISFKTIFCEKLFLSNHNLIYSLSKKKIFCILCKITKNVFLNGCASTLETHTYNYIHIYIICSYYWFFLKKTVIYYKYQGVNVLNKFKYSFKLLKKNMHLNFYVFIFSIFLSRH